MQKRSENQKAVQQLEEVKKAYALWRKNRRNGKELIPKKLMDQAAQLCNIYKTGRIASELRLEFNNLKRYCQEYDRPQKTNLKQSDFIEMNLGQNPEVGTVQHCQITLDTGNGRKISINLENPTADILRETLKAII